MNNIPSLSLMEMAKLHSNNFNKSGIEKSAMMWSSQHIEYGKKILV